MSEEASEAMYPDTGVELVILRTAGGFVVPVLGVTVFDVASGVEPDEQLLSELLDSSVRVTGWEGYPAALLDALADLPVPPTFRASPWLAHSRPAYIGDDGTGSVANFPVHYTPHRGLRIHHPEADEQLQEEPEG